MSDQVPPPFPASLLPQTQQEAASNDDSSTRGPAKLVGELDAVSGSKHQPGPALPVVGI